MQQEATNFAVGRFLFTIFTWFLHHNGSLSLNNRFNYIYACFRNFCNLL